jgi:methyl-accepting chemotaxis protein
LNLPIAWRLALGFLIAAFIAAAGAGVTGLQRAQSLSNESAFYESLLRSNTSLTTANSFLQLMDTKLHETLQDAAAPTPSRETLAADQEAMDGLTARFDTLLANYEQNDLVYRQPEQVAIVTEANRVVQIGQQRSLVDSAARTWQVYKEAQAQILQDVAVGDVASAQVAERAQGEPTNADALSALRALIQFGSRLADTIHEAATVEQSGLLVTALIAAVLAVIAIAVVGWVISNTLVRRLGLLQQVTQAVERGEMGTRIEAVGRDEIGTVSHSVNQMLDTIVGLLEVTQRQHDALASAAERLFADVRVAGAGDLRVNAAVSSDPIGMLANAFNLTVGRFRRFVLRTQSTVDQLDVVARQQHERAVAFHTSLLRFSPGVPAMPAQGQSDYFKGYAVRASVEQAGDDQASLDAQIERARELVRRQANDGTGRSARAVWELVEQAYLSAGRLRQIVAVARQQRTVGSLDTLWQAEMDELRTLGTLLTQLGDEARTLAEDTGAPLATLDDLLGRVANRRGRERHGADDASTTAVTSGASPELVRLATVFAEDVAALARQIVLITQEMRAGLAPFRLPPPGATSSMMGATDAGYDGEQAYPGYGGFDGPASSRPQGRELSGPRW